MRGWRKALIAGGLLMVAAVGRGIGQDEQMAFDPIANAQSPVDETMLRAGYEWGHRLCPIANVRIRGVLMAKPDWVGEQASLLVCDSMQARLVDEIHDLTRLLALAPESPDWWVQRANLYATYLFFDKAIADVSQAIGMRPRYADLYRLRGRWEDRTQDYAGELEDLTQVHELNPEQGSPWQDMADLAHAAGKTDLDELHYRQMAAINPRVLPEVERDDSKLSTTEMSRDELMLRAGYALRVKRQALALRFLNVVLHVEPRYIPALELRYGLEVTRGGVPRPDSPAMADLKLLVELNPAHWLKEMLRVAEANRDDKTALSCLTQMIALEPYVSGLYEMRAALAWRMTCALAHVDLALVDSAIEDYKRSISLSPGTTGGYVGLADIYDGRKDYVREKRMLELALIGDPDNETLKRKLAKLRGDCWPCDTIH
jgi:tetratricopeptide (TPR) repeat protein